MGFVESKSWRALAALTAILLVLLFRSAWGAGGVDADLDGFPADSDCDDHDPKRNPGAKESCDPSDVDEDCNGRADDGDDFARGMIPWYVDKDGDGAGAGEPSSRCDAGGGFAAKGAGDCDDGNKAVGPGAAEICDPADADENCDGKADDADPTAKGKKPFYADADGDGVGGGPAVERCDPAPGLVAGNGDCNDQDKAIAPSAKEVCDAGSTDENCNGKADDADPTATGKTSFYADKDADGYGAGAARAACDAPAGFGASKAGDCNDAAAAVHPGATEACDPANLDEDCDGKADDLDAEATGKTPFFGDNDLDGYGAASPVLRCDPGPKSGAKEGNDCDDTRAGVHPGAAEVCDPADADEDCNGKADDADPAAKGKKSWFKDGDGDGVGGGAASERCDPEAGFVASDGDCNDADKAIRPGATEVCDAASADEDCDGKADDADLARGTMPFYADKDGDGVGSGPAKALCRPSAAFPADKAGDCNDGAKAVHPGAPEVCDPANADEDCDGKADDLDTEATGKTDFFADKDGDGHGAGAGEARCDAGGGLTARAATDCDDAKASVHPGAAEVCDPAATDEDCNGQADDADANARGKRPTWRDGDGDGAGGGDPVQRCAPEKGFVAVSGDCNDASADVRPGATEVCDPANVDEDCDGKADNADQSKGTTPFWADRDADGFGSGAPSALCDATPAFPASQGGDCNDAAAPVHPGATEACDPANADEDCDGKADDLDAEATGKTPFYADKDGDGHGAGEAAPRCDPSPTLRAAAAGDCDDTKASVHPGSSEVCDPADTDEDCSGKADDQDANAKGKTPFFSDADADGFGAGDAIARCDAVAGVVAKAGDCNDGDKAVRPGGTEVCDPANADEDCDGKADNADAAQGTTAYYADRDADGFGGGPAHPQCDASTAFPVTGAGDCNDGNARISPSAAEVCDPANADEDCDGKADNDDEAEGTKPFFADADKDGHGAGPAHPQCDASAAFAATVADDCDDAKATVRPGNKEVCDPASTDEDCNGQADDGDAAASGKVKFYADGDGDTWGGADALRCHAGAGFGLARGGDCDDAAGGVHPGAPEVCDPKGIDEDCNGKADNDDAAAQGTTRFFADADKDQAGAGTGRLLCRATAAFPVTVGGDCNDGAAAVRPGVPEVCDPQNVDEDCSGKADNADPAATGLTSWYFDGDRDGWGSGAAKAQCDATSAASAARAGDCNDQLAAISPGAAEVCDAANADEDCDGKSDDDDDSTTASSRKSWYPDRDGDRYGVKEAGVARCDRPDGHSDQANDCDDASSYVHPGAPELCDGRFDDCASADRWKPGMEAGSASVQAGATWTDVRASFEGFGSTYALPPGGTLWLCPGVHVGRVQIDASADTTVEGRGEGVVLDAQGAGPGVAVTGGTAKKTITLRNLAITNGSAPSGGGVASTSLATLVLDGVALTGNRADREGGGLYVAKPASVTITGSTVAHNRANAGAGIWVGPRTSRGKLVARKVTFDQNSATDEGGAMVADGWDVDAGALTVTGNTARTAAGVVCKYGACTIDGISASKNVATQAGGAFVAVGGTDQTVEVSGLVATANSAESGPALYVNGPKVIAKKLVASDNRASGDGGTIMVASGELTIEDGVVKGGVAGTGAKGGNGGGIYSFGKLTLTRTVVEGNEARPGQTGGSGGGLYLPDGSATISASTLRDNVAADRAGALFAGLAQVTVDGTTIEGNRAFRGGAIFQTGTTSDVTLRTSILKNNTATSQAARFLVQAGAWYLDTGARGSLLERSQIVSNKAIAGPGTSGVQGGGVAAYSPKTRFTCSDSTISGNEATSGAAPPEGSGAYVFSASTLASTACVWDGEIKLTGKKAGAYSGSPEPFECTGETGCKTSVP